MSPRRALPHYKLVDYVTQLYLLAVGLLIVFFHNERTPQWALLLGIHVAGCLVVHALVVGHARRPASRLLRLGRHFYPMPLFTVLYCEACLLNRMVIARYADAPFIRLEAWLFGCQPCVVWMERLPYLALSEPLYLAYVSFYVTVLGVGVALYVKGREEFLRYVALLSLIFYVCYLAFIFVPVAGPPVYWNPEPGLAAAHGLPHLPMAFPAAVERGPLCQAMRFLYARFRVQGGAFPSSHVAVALCTLWFSWRSFPRIRYAHLAAVVLLCVATVYCRYHYAVDVLGGVLAAAVLVPLGERLYSWSEAPVRASSARSCQ